MKNVLEDILLKEKLTDDESSIFNHYVDKSLIANKIFDKIKKYTKNDLFYLSDTNRNVGVISVLDGLKSMSLLSSLGVDSHDDGFIKLLNENLKVLFSEIGYDSNDLDKYLNYYLTPFSKDADVQYVDTAAKLISSICEIREVLAEFDKTEKERKLIFVDGVGNARDILSALTNITNKCLDFLCRSAIENPHPTTRVFRKIDENGNEIKKEVILSHLGWNFTIFNNESLKDGEKEKLEPSLYFTYSVSQAYMSIFESTYRALMAYRKGNIDEERNEVPQEQLAKFDRDLDFIKGINGKYNELKNILNGVGLLIDKKISDTDLRDLYLGSDWKSIDHYEIERSTTNNALFNTLFVISIMNNTGVFDFYNEFEPEERYLDYASSVISNVYDMYMDLEANNKIYIVEQYVLNFNEFIPEAYFEAANYLRKQRIQAITLVPLLVRTYVLISAWIVQYPQKQMIDYLKLVLESRHNVKNTDEKEWIWDKEVYDVTINAIFIGTLYDFYDYYEKYEKPFISTEESIKEIKERADESIKFVKEDARNKVEEINASAEQKINEAIDEVNRIKEERENLPIIVAIKNLVREVLEKELVNYLPNALDTARDYIFSKKTSYSLSSNHGNSGAEKLSDSFITLLSSYFLEGLLVQIDPDADNNFREFNLLKENNYKGLADNKAYRKVLDDAVKKIIDDLSRN